MGDYGFTKIEFLLETLNGFQNVSPKSQTDCIQHIKPWIKNLFVSENQ